MSNTAREMTTAITRVAASNCTQIEVRGREGGMSLVRKYGAGGIPCIFIHGFGEGSYVWSNLIANLPTTQCLYTVDLRGHGDSDWDPEGLYETAQHVHDLLHIVNALGLASFSLVGHSLGGKVAARVAALAQERVASLVVVDTQPETDPAAKAHVRAALSASLKLYDSVEQYAEQLVATRPLPPAGLLTEIAAAALRRRTDGKFELKADPGLAQAYPREENGSEIWDSLKAVSCPALIIRGAYSGILSNACAHRMVASMRAAALATVPAAGHSVMIDNPDGFRKTIEPFLRQFHSSAMPLSQACIQAAEMRVPASLEH